MSAAIGNTGSASFIECGLSKFVLQYINNKSTQEIREELISRYSRFNRLNDGHVLKTSELRYLTITSKTLNQFIDRGVYQKAVRALDPEIIEDVPLSDAR